MPDNASLQILERVKRKWRICDLEIRHQTIDLRLHSKPKAQKSKVWKLMSEVRSQVPELQILGA